MALPPLVTALWILLPAGAANITPVLAAWLLPSWDRPVDLGGRLGGKPLFGSHKTWRGMIAGVLAGGLLGLLLQHLADAMPGLAPFPAPGLVTPSPLLGA